MAGIRSSRPAGRFDGSPKLFREKVTGHNGVLAEADSSNVGFIYFSDDVHTIRFAQLQDAFRANLLARMRVHLQYSPSRGRVNNHSFQFRTRVIHLSDRGGEFG